jgi:hypothetical protein
LLIEEGRTNLLLRSQDFSTSWPKVAVSVTANSTTAPDGTLTADTLTATSTGVFRYTFQDITLTNGVTYTLTAYLKYKTARYVWLLGETSGDAFAIFDLLTGTVGNATAGVTRSIEPVGNGWYRCTATFTVSSATSTQQIGFGLSDTNTAVFPPATAGIDTFIWGAQLEAGSFPTSYIPTTTGTAVRSADVCSITGGNFNNFYNQSEGTVDISASTANAGNAVMLFAFSDGTTNNFTQSLPGTSSLVVNTLSSIQANLNAGNFTNNVVSRLAIAFKLNDFAVTRNGGTVFTDNVGTLPTVNQIGIGSRISTVQLNGHIQYLRYYKKRLPNAKLQALTT